MKFKIITLILLSVFSLCSCNVETYSYTGENNTYDSNAATKEEITAAVNVVPTEVTTAASEEKQTEVSQIQTEVATENTLTTDVPTSNAVPEVQESATEATAAPTTPESPITTNENGEVITPEVN